MRVNLLVILISKSNQAPLYSDFGVVVSAYENAKEKAALPLSEFAKEFAKAIPKPVACGFSGVLEIAV